MKRVNQEEVKAKEEVDTEEMNAQGGGRRTQGGHVFELYMNINLKIC